MDTCRSSEATCAHLKAISGQLPNANTLVENVNALDMRKKSRAPPKQRNNNPKQPVPESKEMLKCYKHCGRRIKQRTKCPAFGMVCRTCNRPNHFAEMCRSTPGRTSRPRNGVNMVDPDYSSEEELQSVTFVSTEGNVHTIHEDNLPGNKILAAMEIAGESVQMQIDTGASCNVLPQKFVSPGTNIAECDRTLKMYSKSIMPVLGTWRVGMRNSKEKKYNAEFVVVKGDYTPLIGSHASQRMNLVTVQQENIQQVTTNTESLALDQLEEEFGDVFKNKAA